ncbi:MAG: succinylglutamate desuccinylase [Aliidiomarina sp.]|uniref:succinylglutamate desuccinylase n=1 Tax=Aliidiomarina sp. TaxID=1872439 RepID=UPI0025BB5B09|nr:succinylglutamate desuccinylase [Aliidiomarina sp.]MCH8500560.1 succinylglutamate desuccinylase [Aliidiomarina sp.]
MVQSWPDDSFLAFTRQHEWGGLAPVSSQLSNGVRVIQHDSGVIEFIPPEQSAALDVVLSCAVHGDETAPIEICDELISALMREEFVPKSRVLFLIANPAAINIGQRFVEENMNRLFSGGHSQGEGLINRERERAKALEGFVIDFFAATPRTHTRIHYDLHTAIRDSKHEKFAVYPYQNGKPYSAEQLRLLAALDVPVVLLHEGPTTTFSYFSVNACDAHGFTVELGKVRPFGENDMTRFTQTKAQLLTLIRDGLNIEATPRLTSVQIYQVQRSINRTQTDFQLNFPDDVANFTSFKQGDLLARDGSEPVYAEQDGEAIIFPNAKVAIGQRALLTVMPVAMDKLNVA